MRSVISFFETDALHEILWLKSVIKTVGQQEVEKAINFAIDKKFIVSQIHRIRSLGHWDFASWNAWL